MKIAYTIASGKGNVDLLLYRVAHQLAQRSIKCCGTTQINNEGASGHCDMDVQVLPDGPTLRISQDLGAASRGCRLDPNALETAVALVDRSLNDDTDALIINKFGKHEAEGRGFRDVIAKAIEKDIPVIVGVNSLNKQAFEAFVGLDVVQLKPSVADIVTWVENEAARALRVD